MAKTSDTDRLFLSIYQRYRDKQKDLARKWSALPAVEQGRVEIWDNQFREGAYFRNLASMRPFMAWANEVLPGTFGVESFGKKTDAFERVTGTCLRHPECIENELLGRACYLDRRKNARKRTKA